MQPLMGEVIQTSSLQSAPSRDAGLRITVPGVSALPAIEGTTYRFEEVPIFQKVEPFLGSWGHHYLHPAVIMIPDGERTVPLERFLINRNNRFFQWWSIPDLNDYGFMSIQDGIRWTFGDRLSEDGEQCVKLTRRPSEIPGLQTPAGDRQWSDFESSDPFVKADESFIIWKDSQLPLPGVSMLTPVLFPNLRTGSDDRAEMGWLREVNYAGGAVWQEVLSFSNGWSLIRDGSTSLGESFRRLREPVADATLEAAA